MRLRRRRIPRGQLRILYVVIANAAPHPYLIERLRRTGEAVRELYWSESQDGKPPLGRFVEFGDRGVRRHHPMSVKVISPRMLVEFVRAEEDVVLIYELGLVGLYAGLSKALRPHKVISLIEGDYRHIGRTGTVALKVALRRFAAQFVDVFVANNLPARDYLIRTLKVPDKKIVVGWWLAGLPSELEPRLPEANPVPQGVPLFVYAGQLVPRKGVDLLIEAVAAYRQEFGPCMLWVIGEGPQRDSLVQLTSRLGVEDSVTFLGTVDHAALKGAFEACDAFVLPTLQDLVGRAAVEALTAGALVVVSPMTGAVGTIVQDGVNGIVVDPQDTRALAEALHRAADPETACILREGVRRMNAALSPHEAAQVLLSALAFARNGPHAAQRAEL